MRSDMHKVVVERERYGSARKNRKWGQRLALVRESDYDDQLKFVSSARGRQYGHQQKWFTDVLGPLEGFLRSHLCRPWDKVFSELRQGLEVRKVTGRHIFEHVHSMVETDCWIGADGKVYGYPRGHEVTGVPGTGLLCFLSWQSAGELKKRRLMQQEIDEIQLDGSHGYKLIDGQWYLVTYEMVEMAGYESACTMWVLFSVGLFC